MTEKRLASGAVSYYWAPRTVDRNTGCTVHAEALGSDYGTAKARADILNLQLTAWRSGSSDKLPDEARSDYGTVRWLHKTYLASDVFKRKVSKRSQPEYRSALSRIEDIPTTTGDVVGNLPVVSISQGAVDKIYAKLQVGPRGKRVRQANISVETARRAWKVVQRLHADMVPILNPWIGVEKDLTRTSKSAATREEAYRLAYALKELGEPHLGAAALICFEWHQRPEHVRGGDITWADWRPANMPGYVNIRHHKTGVKGWVPLEDDDGPLYPELEAYLTSLPRLGLPIVLTAARRGPARPYSAEYAQRRVREARKMANLELHVTLDTCRHGGITELGDAGATESEIMSASMHKTPQAARLYVKKTEAQRLQAGRKRRTYVERKASGSRNG